MAQRQLQPPSCCRSLTYNCYGCQLPFKSKDEFFKHLLGHFSSPNYYCSCCDNYSGKISSLKQHCRDKHGKHDSVIHCNFCHFMTDSEESVRQHTAAIHLVQNLGYYCTMCNFIVVNQGSIEKHLQKVHRVTLSFCYCSVPDIATNKTTFYSFNCSYCSFKTHTYNSLLDHFKDSHLDYEDDDSEGSGYSDSFDASQLDDEKVQDCLVCGFCTYDTQEIFEHLKFEHRTLIDCHICKKIIVGYNKYLHN